MEAAKFGCHLQSSCLISLQTMLLSRFPVSLGPLQHDGVMFLSYVYVSVENLFPSPRGIA